MRKEQPQKRRVEFNVLPSSRTMAISIRMPGDLIVAIREVARRQGIPYQKLIKEWLYTKLHDVNDDVNDILQPKTIKS